MIKRNDANQDQVRASTDMLTPRNKKEILCLIGRLAALGKFISRYLFKCHPFFKTLNESQTCTLECEQAFESIKENFVQYQILSNPLTDQTIGLYLAAFNIVVSLLMFIDGKEKPTLFIHKKTHKS